MPLLILCLLWQLSVTCHQLCQLSLWLFASCASASNLGQAQQLWLFTLWLFTLWLFPSCASASNLWSRQQSWLFTLWLFAWCTETAGLAKTNVAENKAFASQDESSCQSLKCMYSENVTDMCLPAQLCSLLQIPQIRRQMDSRAKQRQEQPHIPKPEACHAASM